MVSESHGGLRRLYGHLLYRAFGVSWWLRAYRVEVLRTATTLRLVLPWWAWGLLGGLHLVARHTGRLRAREVAGRLRVAPAVVVVERERWKSKKR